MSIFFIFAVAQYIGFLVTLFTPSCTVQISCYFDLYIIHVPVFCMTSVLTTLMYMLTTLLPSVFLLSLVNLSEKNIVPPSPFFLPVAERQDSLR